LRSYPWIERPSRISNSISIELEYEVWGTGEPVVLAHYGVGVDWFGLLLEEPVLTDGYRVLGHHRAGFAGSSRVRGSLSFEREAVHCRSPMHHLGIERMSSATPLAR
jgi:hypothetical protein